MTRIVDEDVVRIKTHVATDAYREGWERAFGDKDASPEPGNDGIELKFHLQLWYCTICKAGISDPENHQYHAIIRLDEA